MGSQLTDGATPTIDGGDSYAYKCISPPYSIIWRTFNHVLFDWSNIKYSIYYYLVFLCKKEKINSFYQSIMRQMKNAVSPAFS